MLFYNIPEFCDIWYNITEHTKAVNYKLYNKFVLQALWAILLYPGVLWSLLWYNITEYTKQYTVNYTKIVLSATCTILLIFYLKLCDLWCGVTLLNIQQYSI